MEIAIAILLFCPAVLALAYAFYSIVKFILSRRDASLKNELVVGALGVFSIFAPKLLSVESKKYFARFLMAAGFFCFYAAMVMLMASFI